MTLSEEFLANGIVKIKVENNGALRNLRACVINNANYNNDFKFGDMVSDHKIRWFNSFVPSKDKLNELRLHCISQINLQK